MNEIMERIRLIPWWIRALLALAILAGAMKLAVGWIFDDFESTTAEEYGAGFESRGSGYDWRGRFWTNDVALQTYDEDGARAQRLLADRLVVTPPSWLWLSRQAMRASAPRWTPPEFGVTLENFRTADADGTQPGNYTNLPFDAMGCGKDMLTPRDIAAMGLPAPRRDLHVGYVRSSLQSVDATIRLESAGLGRLTLATKVALTAPVPTRELVQRILEAPLASASITVDDLGFVAARNRACARRNGMDAEAFHAFHLREVERHFARSQAWYGDSAMQQYAEFARNGGTLHLASTGERELTLGEYLAIDWGRKPGALPMRITANGRPAVAVHYRRVGRSMPLETALAASPSPQAAVPTAAVAVELPKPGDEVGYDAASGLVGEHIDVRTRYGSQRKGTLLVHSPPMITLKLDTADGGFTLTLNRQDVATIRYTPVGAVDGAAGSH